MTDGSTIGATGYGRCSRRERWRTEVGGRLRSALLWLLIADAVASHVPPSTVAFLGLLAAAARGLWCLALALTAGAALLAAPRPD